MNYLRVQADNLDQPFDLNQRRQARSRLDRQAAHPDHLSRDRRRAARALRRADRRASSRRSRQRPPIRSPNGRPSISPRAPSAACRRCSRRRWRGAIRRAPGERFFTGGGVHQFANFNADDNGRVMSVAEAFRHSVNLVFIRMMRDIVAILPGGRARPPRRSSATGSIRCAASYLARFADREGTTFLNRFYDEFAGLSPDQVLERLAGQVRPRADAARGAVPLAAAGRRSARRSTRSCAPACAEPPSERELARLYDGHGPDRSQPQRPRPISPGCIRSSCGSRPIWQEHPGATRSAMLDGERGGAPGELCLAVQDPAARPSRTSASASCSRRRRSSGSTRPGGASAIRSTAWCRPTPRRSAARPTGRRRWPSWSGILLNDGIWQPTVRVEQLHFAADTPYETVLVAAAPAGGRRARARDRARRCARRWSTWSRRARRAGCAAPSATSDGVPIAIGAKTGTGDHRRKSFGPGGRLIESQVVSRTATVVFFIGDRLFGNITVYVAGRRCSRLPLHELAAGAAAQGAGAGDPAAARWARHAHRRGQDPRRGRLGAVPGPADTPARSFSRSVSAVTDLDASSHHAPHH